MVCNDTHSNIDLRIVAIFLTAKTPDFPDNRLEYIGVIIRRLSLQRHTKPFESHTGIDYPSRKRFERTIGFTVILHKHKVPYLYHLRVTLVNQFQSIDFGSLGITPQIDVNLRTGSTRSRISHFPKIIMSISVDYMIFGQMRFPIRGSLVISLQTFGRISFEYGSV